MGCWNETCAVTNTPIRYGMPNVKMVLFKLLKMSAQHNQYQLIRMASEPLVIRRSFFDVLTGDYDDYGRLTCADFPPELNTYQYFFVNGDAWDAVVAFVQSQLDNPDEYVGWDYKHYMKCFETIVKTESFAPLDDGAIFPVGKEEKFKEVLYVLCFLQYTRRDPWIGDRFRGSQSMNLEEHKLIAEQILKIASNKEDN